MTSYRFTPIQGTLAKGAILPLAFDVERNHVNLQFCQQAQDKLIAAAREFRLRKPGATMVVSSFELNRDNNLEVKRPYLCYPTGGTNRPESTDFSLLTFTKFLQDSINDPQGLGRILFDLPQHLKRTIWQIIVVDGALYLSDRSVMFTGGEIKQNDLEQLRSEIAWSRIARFFATPPSAHELIAFEEPLLKAATHLVERLGADVSGKDAA